MNQIINFGHITYLGRSNCCSINGCIRTNFHIITNNHISCLGDFFMDIFPGNKSKTITADNGSAVDNYTITDFNFTVNGNIGVKPAMLADNYIRSNIHIGSYP